MNFQREQNKNLSKNYGDKEKAENKAKNRLNDLFSQSWEVFVIKRDQKTGKFISKVACCALEPV